MKKVTANSPSYCINKLICGYQPIYTSGSNYHTSLIQEYMLYTAPHPLKTKAGGRPIVVAPLVLFCDDTSGNRGKKWNKFDSWSFVLGGLPQKDSRKPANVHVISCSNSVSPLDMARPIAAQLKQAEDWIECFDVSLQTTMLLQAPLILLLGDNPRHSELLNHMGSSAKKFCRMCMV